MNNPNLQLNEFHPVPAPKFKPGDKIHYSDGCLGTYDRTIIGPVDYPFPKRAGTRWAYWTSSKDHFDGVGYAHEDDIELVPDPREIGINRLADLLTLADIPFAFERRPIAEKLYDRGVRVIEQDTQ